MKLLPAVPIALALAMVFSLMLILILSIPVYFLWNWLAPVFLYQLPPVYLKFSYMQIAGIFMLFYFLRALFTANVKLS